MFKANLRQRILETAIAVLLASTVTAISQISNPGVQQGSAVVAGHCVSWGPGTGQIQDAGAACAAGGATGANPTATAGATAVNGAAATFMRSDAAPAVAATTFGGQSVAPGQSAAVQGNGAKVQLATGAVVSQNCAKFDASGNVVDNGAACATQSSGANPSATASDTANNGVSTFFMRADASPAVQKASNAAFGVMHGDGSTLDCTGTSGVCVAKVNAILPTPTRAGDVLFWNGTTWVVLAGNNAGTQVFSENASGVPAWSSAGTGTVTSAQVASGTGISVSGTCTITTSGVCTVSLSTPVSSTNGGTGVSNPTANAVLIGEGASPAASVGPGTKGQSLVSNGAGVDPSFQSGQWVLLNTLTASGSANLNDTTSLTATYKDYMLVFESLVPATNAVGCQLLVHSGGVFPSTSYSGVAARTTATTGISNPTTFIACDGGNTSTQNTGVGISGEMIIFNPSNTTAPKNVTGLISYQASGQVSISAISAAWTGGNTAVDGFEVVFSSGNITSGSIRVYGRL